MKSWHHIESPRSKSVKVYQRLALASLIIGLLSAAFVLVLWLGVYQNAGEAISSLARSIRGYTLLVMIVHDMSIFIGLASLKAEKKLIPIIAIVLCVLVFFPLLAMLMDRSLIGKYR